MRRGRRRFFSRRCLWRGCRGWRGWRCLLSTLRGFLRGFRTRSRLRGSRHSTRTICFSFIQKRNVITDFTILTGSVLEAALLVTVESKNEWLELRGKVELDFAALAITVCVDRRELGLTGKEFDNRSFEVEDTPIDCAWEVELVSETS